MEKFFKLLKKEDEGAKKDKTLWEHIQKMSEDFKEQEIQLKEKEECIEQKRIALEARGINIDTSNIIKHKPQPVEHNNEEPSIYDMMRQMENRIAVENRYLNQLEKAYDEALAKEPVVEKMRLISKKEI